MNWNNLSAEAKNKPLDTLASARAAQIFSEMLGMVYHKEYIGYQQDQTVYITLPPFPPQSTALLIYDVGICRAF